MSITLIPAGTSKRTGKPYPAKVTIDEKVGGITISLGNDWKNQGLGVALSGAVAVTDLPRIAALVAEHSAAAAALLNQSTPTFTADTGFTPDTAPALQSPALVGAPIGTTGNLDGVGRVKVTSTEGHYELV